MSENVVFFLISVLSALFATAQSSTSIPILSNTALFTPKNSALSLLHHSAAVTTTILLTVDATPPSATTLATKPIAFAATSTPDPITSPPPNTPPHTISTTTHAPTSAPANTTLTVDKISLFPCIDPTTPTFILDITHPFPTTALTSKTTTPPPPTTPLTSNTTTPSPPTTAQTSNTTTPPFHTTALTSNTTTPPPSTTALTSNTTTSPFPTTALTSNTTTPPFPTTALTSKTTTPPPLTTGLTSNTTAPPPPTTPLTSNTTTPPPPTTALTSKTTTPPSFTTSLKINTTTPPCPTTALTSKATTPPPPTTLLTSNTTTPPPPNTALSRKTRTPPPQTTTLSRKTTTPPTPTTPSNSDTTTPPPPTTALISKTTTPPHLITSLTRNTTAPPFPTTALTSNTSTPPFPTTALTSNTTTPPPPTTSLTRNNTTLLFTTTALTTKAATPSPLTTAPTTTPLAPTISTLETTPLTTTPLTSNTITPPPHTTALTSNTTTPPFRTTALTSNTTTPPPSTTALTSNTTIPPPSTTALTSNTTTLPPSTTALTSNTTTPPFRTTALTSNTTTPPPSTVALTSNTTTPPFRTTALTSNTTTPPPSTVALTSNITTPPFPTTALTSKTITPPPPSTPSISNTTTPPPLTTALTSNTTTLPPFTTFLTSSTTTPPFRTTALTSNTTTPPPSTTALTSNTTRPPFPTTPLTSNTTTPPPPTTALTSKTTTPPPPNTLLTSNTTTPPPLITSLTRNTTTPLFTTTALTTKAATPSPLTTAPTTTPLAPTISTLETTSSSTSAWTTTVSNNSTDPPFNTTALNTTTPPSNTTTASTTTSTLTIPPPTDPTTVTHITTVSTTTLPTTLPPPVCLNGGELQGGVCICLDEWTGVTCSIPNVCPMTTLDGFEFPQTVIGWFAYSSETCPAGTTNAGISMASTRCSDNKGVPQFDRIQKIQCQVTLLNIQANVSNSITAEEAHQLASHTQILTSRPEQLTASNITSAAGIVNTILSNSANITEETAVAAVTTISQLLTANPQEFTEPSEATVGLTETLETFSVNPNNTVSRVVQPRLVLQSTQVPPAQTTGVQFGALSGRTNNFTTNRIQLRTNVSEILDTEIPSDVQIFIRLPTERLHKNSNVSVGFVLYENDLLFRSKTFRPTLNSRRMVISGTLGDVRAEHVTLRFLPRNLSNKFLHDFACVFWNYSINDWSTSGCSKASLSTGTLQCRCNHTTNFAVLMSFRENHKYAESLNVISIVGCSLSIPGLILTILFQIFTRKSRKATPTVLLISICVCMTIFCILFLSGINNPSEEESTDRNKTVSKENSIPSSDLHQEPDRGLCTAFTALMQYFLLATFTWNTLYAAHIFLLIKETFLGPPRGFLAGSIAIGWGLPAVVVAVTLGVTYRVDNPLGYRREDFCWLAALNQDGNFDFGKPLFWGFLLPVSIMLLLNTVVLIYFGTATCKKDPLLTSTKSTSLKKKFMSSFSLVVILGFTWVLGYLVLSTEGDASYIFSLLFCVFNTTQGLHVFILFTVRTARFRKTFFSITSSVSAPDIALYRKSYTLWRPRRNGSHGTSRDVDHSVGTFSQRNPWI